MQSDSRAPSLNARLVSIGISESYASQLASRKRSPSLKLALRIEAELAIPVSYWVAPPAGPMEAQDAR